MGEFSPVAMARGVLGFGEDRGLEDRSCSRPNRGSASLSIASMTRQLGVGVERRKSPVAFSTFPTFA
jgi:hypothetical protein